MMTLNKIKEYLKDDENRKKYREVMKLKYLKPQPQKLSHYWNVMDKGCLYSKVEDFKNPKAKILHFTNVRIQPWFYPKHSQAKIWEKWFLESFREGRITKEEVEEAVSNFDFSNPRRPNGMAPYWLEVIK